MICSVAVQAEWKEVQNKECQQISQGLMFASLIKQKKKGMAWSEEGVTVKEEENEKLNDGKRGSRGKDLNRWENGQEWLYWLLVCNKEKYSM